MEGIYRIMESGYDKPLNLGTDELVTVNELVGIVADAAGKTFTTLHDVSKPQGVRGRNSDNSRLRGVLGWEPTCSLRDGMAPTYRWISAQTGQQAGGNQQATPLLATLGGSGRRFQ